LGLKEHIVLEETNRVVPFAVATRDEEDDHRGTRRTRRKRRGGRGEEAGEAEEAVAAGRRRRRGGANPGLWVCGRLELALANV
jgi:hypothetical protein